MFNKFKTTTLAGIAAAHPGRHQLSAITRIYSSTSDGNADYEGLRGRADLGIEYSLGEAGTLDVNTFVDGLGSDYQGHGMDIGYNLKF